MEKQFLFELQVDRNGSIDQTETVSGTLNQADLLRAMQEIGPNLGDLVNEQPDTKLSITASIWEQDVLAMNLQASGTVQDLKTVVEAIAQAIQSASNQAPATDSAGNTTTVEIPVAPATTDEPADPQPEQETTVTDEAGNALVPEEAPVAPAEEVQAETTLEETESPTTTEVTTDASEPAPADDQEV